MWSAIILWFKHKFKRKLKKRLKVGVADQLRGSDAEEVKKLKNTIFNLNIGFYCNLLFSTIVLALIAGIIVYSMYFMMSAGTIFQVVDTGDNDVDKQMEEAEVVEEISQGTSNSGLLNISGGIYPKDKTLKSRAILLEMIEKCCKYAYDDTGYWIEPAYILGTICRETGDTLFVNLDSSTDKDIWSDLVVFSPACCKWGTCGYVKNNISHFVGGVVENGVDKGDPYTQKIDTSEKSYGIGKDAGGHAIGVVQFECIYVYEHVKRMYPIGEYESIATHQMDNTLGFIRPNPLYLPDCLYNCAHSNNPKYMFGGSDWKNITKSDEFNRLNDRNKSFIYMVYAGAKYGRGSSTTRDDEMVKDLMNLANTGKVEYLDEMLDPIKDSFYDSKSHRPIRQIDLATEYLTNTYGLKYKPTSFGTDPGWYGLWAATMGRVVWDRMVAEIDLSEKEVAGGTGDYVGSGKFPPLSHGKYYSNVTQCTLYRQTSKNTAFSEASWGMYPLNSAGCNMTSGGCGIYSLAFAATSLLGKEVNPLYARKLLESSLKQDGVSLGNHLTYALTDSGVLYLARKLGLDIDKRQFVGVSDSAFEASVINELQKGNLILGVWRKGPYEWYNGDGHFMVIRGYNNKNNKLRVFTSVPTEGNGWDLETTNSREVEASRVKKYFARNRDNYWVLGRPGNVDDLE